ncbi:pyrophosphatase PpaX [Shimazuella alba]|uniref:Pyrophosphatase PpaX n=1 Tax=Shimazuella alba TaxID=2690964 RepID=A0A6I4W3H5_9BACL|nr:pyrophosphatase PpaX [Shimazuella alba]MXQ54852.1 pyrophosphatase PpaX [Shimazuella alba]
MRYSTVLFDLDGTLINTNELILASFEHTFDIHCPNKFTREDVMPIMGEPLTDQMHFFDPVQADEMVKTYRLFNETEHDRLVEEFPHVLSCLEKLYEYGITMGVTSNKRRVAVEQGLRRFGMEKWMKTIICEGEAERNKPHPDMLLLAMEQLHVSAKETLFVGDSRYDILAAERAGIDSVGVAWSLHVEDVKNHQPTYWIEEMRELLEIVGVE